MHVQPPRQPDNQQHQQAKKVMKRDFGTASPRARRMQSRTDPMTVLVIAAVWGSTSFFATFLGSVFGLGGVGCGGGGIGISFPPLQQMMLRVTMSPSSPAPRFFSILARSDFAFSFPSMCLKRLAMF